ncbi:hypothetical protein D3C86_1161980 [compost metagenome]
MRNFCVSSAAVENAHGAEASGSVASGGETAIDVASAVTVAAAVAYDPSGMITLTNPVPGIPIGASSRSKEAVLPDKSRPPLRAPALKASATSTMSPGSGIAPSAPGANVTASLSAYSSHRPKRRAWPRDVQPTATTSVCWMRPHFAISSGRSTISTDCLYCCSGSFQVTAATL